MPKYLTKKQMDDAVKAMKETGNQTKAALLLGISRGALQSRLIAANYNGSGKTAHETLRSLRKEVDELRQKELNVERAVRKALGLVPTKDDTPKVSLSASAPKGKTPMVPIIFGSDYQYGEVIRRGEVEGINEYNSEIAEARLTDMFNKAVTISKHYLGQYHSFPAVIYVRAGDLFSGEIHEELTKTNDQHSISAVRRLVGIESALIRKLRKFFDKVVVVTVAGNHGRTTRKPEAKRAAETNYDTLSAWVLEMVLQDDKSIIFKTSLSGDALVQVFGYNFLFTHGDRIGSRGGAGFIGAAGTVTRGFKKVHEYYAHIGVRLDYICVGHFHTSMKLEHGFVNGCLSGYSEYAKSGRYRPAPASQWLLLVTPDQGVAYPVELYLSSRPRFDATDQVAVV